MIWIRRLLVATGAVIVVLAVRGVLTSLGPDLDHYLRYIVVAWLANDLLVLPAAICLGFVLTRWLPTWAKPVVQAALFISLAVVIVALPSVIGKGVPADNPSALPRNYTVGLIVTLSAVWLVTAALVARRFQLARNSSRVDAPEAGPQ